MKWLACCVPALALVGCDPGPPKPTDPKSLLATLTDLQGFGNKHVGSDEDRQAGEYVRSRMVALGLSDVHLESFAFPRHVVSGSSLAVTVGGVATPMAHEVFEGSGAGHADGDVVWCSSAKDADLVGLTLTGKVALVVRDPSFHRSAQYRNVSEKGATAMVYLSAAAENLIQVGSVRLDGWAPLGPIPAITIGADDGAKLMTAAMGAPGAVHVVVDVQATSVAATGNNVVGRIAGSDAGGTILIGGHYDTWFAGSSDNGGGVAAMLALAERRLKEPRPRYTLVFIGYDGEEVALYGGYDYLRKHRIVAQDPILAVLNFEVPSATQSTIAGLARSNTPALDDALMGANLGYDYPLYVPMEVVPMILGGLIPTDIQGFYRNGVPTASTAALSPFYHTTKDTPDKVDVVALAAVVDDFDAALKLLFKDDPGKFVGLDAKLWQAKLAPRARAAGGAPLTLDVTVTSATNVPQTGASVDAVLMVDDYFPTASLHGTTDGNGQVTFEFPAAAADGGQGNRYVHVSAGPSYPYVEQILALP